MFVVPLGRRRAVGLYRSATTGMLVLVWRGGHASDVRELLRLFRSTDQLISAYGSPKRQ